MSTGENGLMVIVQVLDDDIAADAVREKSTVCVPDEILPSVAVVADDGLKLKAFLMRRCHVTLLEYRSMTRA